MKLDVYIDAPIITIKPSINSQEYILIDLGKIYIQNEFQTDPVEGIKEGIWYVYYNIWTSDITIKVNYMLTYNNYNLYTYSSLIKKSIRFYFR